MKEYLIIYDNQVRKFNDEKQALRFYRLMKLHGVNCNLYYKFKKQPKLYEME